MHFAYSFYIFIFFFSFSSWWILLHVHCFLGAMHSSQSDIARETIPSYMLLCRLPVETKVSGSGPTALLTYCKMLLLVLLLHNGRAKYLVFSIPRVAVARKNVVGMSEVVSYNTSLMLVLFYFVLQK